MYNRGLGLHEIGVLQTFMVLVTLTFSVYILNIFICIISESYTKERKNVAQTLAKERARSILTFLLRASDLWNPTRGSGCRCILASCLILCFGMHMLQVVGVDEDVRRLRDGRIIEMTFYPSQMDFFHTESELLRVFVQFLFILIANISVLFCSIGRSAPFRTRTSEGAPQHLWIISPRGIAETAKETAKLSKLWLNRKEEQRQHSRALQDPKNDQDSLGSTRTGHL